MQTVLYNVSNIRSPLTGIGRYALNLIQGAERAQKPITVVHRDRIIANSEIADLIERLDQSRPNANHWRSLIGRLPQSREVHNKMSAARFSRLLGTPGEQSTLFHNICYTPCNLQECQVITLFDLSHRLARETHPNHRVQYLDRLMRELEQGKQQIITISHSVKNEISQHYAIDPGRIHVTPLAANSSYRPRAESDCSAVLLKYGLLHRSFLLCVATLEPRKNLDAVLRAYQALPKGLQTEYPLVLAGARGWKDSKLSRRMKKLQTEGLVKYLGYVAQADLPLLYSSAKLFVYPSLYEGFGLPLLEALQSGTPCITSNQGALAEVSSGAAVEICPSEISAISDAISNLLHNDQLCCKLVERGQQRAKIFSWDATIEKTWSVYELL